MHSILDDFIKRKINFQKDKKLINIIMNENNKFTSTGNTWHEYVFISRIIDNFK